MPDAFARYAVARHEAVNSAGAKLTAKTMEENDKSKNGQQQEGVRS